MRSEHTERSRSKQTNAMISESYPRFKRLCVIACMFKCLCGFPWYHTNENSNFPALTHSTYIAHTLSKHSHIHSYNTAHV